MGASTSVTPAGLLKVPFIPALMYFGHTVKQPIPDLLNSCSILTGFILYKVKPEDELQIHAIQPTADGHSGLTQVYTVKHSSTAFST